MTNVTFSIDDDIHKKMKAHPEIKWTEILRNSIIEYLKKMEETDILQIEEFRKNLDPEVLNMIKELDEMEEHKFHKKTKQMEKERIETQQKLERG